jgi:hypothetical protein
MDGSCKGAERLPGGIDDRGLPAELRRSERLSTALDRQRRASYVAPGLTGAIAQSPAAVTSSLGGAAARKRFLDTEARLAATSQYNVAEKG